MARPSLTGLTKLVPLLLRPFVPVIPVCPMVLVLLAILLWPVVLPPLRPVPLGRWVSHLVRPMPIRGVRSVLLVLGLLCCLRRRC